MDGIFIDERYWIYALLCIIFPHVSRIFTQNISYKDIIQKSIIFEKIIGLPTKLDHVVDPVDLCMLTLQELIVFS